MIKFPRSAEPSGLAGKRAAQLRSVGATKPERTDAHSKAYKSVKDDLVTMQNYKCCYCEVIVVPDFNDVEHYRPFSKYWWLAWTWENLMFACAACNRGGKSDAFPLVDASKALVYPMAAPGAEAALLLDPTADDPREHIRFEKRDEFNGRWAPIGITERGVQTIRELDLSRDSYMTLFNLHVSTTVQNVIDDILTARAEKDDAAFARVWARKSKQLLFPECQYRALSEDVLRDAFPTFPEPPPR